MNLSSRLSLGGSGAACSVVVTAPETGSTGAGRVCVTTISGVVCSKGDGRACSTIARAGPWRRLASFGNEKSVESLLFWPPR
jgi:hypothetical protein